MSPPVSGPRFADSVFFGAVAFSWALGCDLLTGFQVSARQELPAAVAVVLFPGIQVLALLNMFFVVRDAVRGQGQRAALGFILSLAAALEPLLVPILSR